MEAHALVPSEVIQNQIYFLRGQKVMLSRDLALLYGVLPKVLIQAVKRNPERFPSDFVFQLSNQELAILKSQTVTSSWGGSRVNPYAFTEQGVAMLSSVLKSRQAIRVNVEVMRTFVRLRRILSSHKDLARKLEELEKKYDEKFAGVFEAIRQLMKEPEKKNRKIGFSLSENRGV